MTRLVEQCMRVCGFEEDFYIQLISGVECNAFVGGGVQEIDRCVAFGCFKFDRWVKGVECV